MPKIVPHTVKQKFIRLRGEGRPLRACACACGISLPTAISYARTYAKEIKDAELEHKLNAAYNPDDQITTLAQMNTAILRELATRSFSKTPTTTLLNSLTKNFTLLLKAGKIKGAEQDPDMGELFRLVGISPPSKL